MSLRLIARDLYRLQDAGWSLGQVIKFATCAISH